MAVESLGLAKIVLVYGSSTTVLSSIIDPSDPSDVDPEDHVTFEIDDSSELFGFAIPKSDSIRGHLTIDVTGIGRAYFIERRQDHYFMLYDRYLRFLQAYRDARVTRNIDRVREIYDRICEANDSNSEFASFNRLFFRYKDIGSRFESLKRDLGL